MNRPVTFDATLTAGHAKESKFADHLTLIVVIAMLAVGLLVLVGSWPRPCDGSNCATFDPIVTPAL